MVIWAILCSVVALVALANLAVLLGLIARMRVLEAAAAAGGPTARLPELGRAIRPFDVTTARGDAVDQRALASGTALVGFFTAGCRKCARLRSALVASPPAIPTLFLINADAESPEAQAIGAPLLGVGKVAYFEDPAVARAFGVLGYPTLLRIEDGKIAAAGRDLEDLAA